MSFTKLGQFIESIRLWLSVAIRLLVTVSQPLQMAASALINFLARALKILYSQLSFVVVHID